MMKLSDIVNYREPMKKWREHWTATLVGVGEEVKGEGETRDAATESLFKRVAAALVGSSTPVLISAHGLTALVWRDRADWWYTVRFPESKQGNVTTNTHLIGGDRTETERACRRHLADYIRDREIPIEDAALVITHEGDRAQWIVQAHYSDQLQALMAGGLTWEQATHELDERRRKQGRVVIQDGAMVP